jgi:hypothetical protein
MKKPFSGAAISLAICFPLTATAENVPDTDEIEAMANELKQHEQKLIDWEQRLEQVEKRTVTSPIRTGDNAYNPAISLVLQGGVMDYSQEPEHFHFEGMPLGGEAGLQEEGLAIWETELTASANVDNLFYGQTTIGMHTHDGSIEVDIEEAFADTLSLPGGLGLRFGRFYSAIGYLNDHHTHAWDFADAPLAYQAFLGKQYRDDGLRATWVAPIDTILVELGGELLHGETYPGGEHDKSMGTARDLFVQLGGDLGQNHSWQFGLSYLSVNTVTRTTGGHSHDHEEEEEEAHDAVPAFHGDTDLILIDGVWKIDLSGERALVFQGEYLIRDEDGEVSLSEHTGEALIDYQGDQVGWYLQGIYQFNRQWRTGLRYDRLSADNDLAMRNNTTDEEDEHLFEASGYHSSSENPHRATLMLDWSPSEFSRLRLQYAQDDSREKTDHQLALQYILTLGAHGAHQF